MAKLSKNNKYAICWLNSQGYSNKEISEEINVPLTQVNRTVKMLTTNEQEETVSEEVSKKQTSKDFMITRTSEKGNNHVAIMTKTAAQMNDEIGKKNKELINNLDRPGIFRPNK
jgi:adenosylmethionine-8-amino-7-oxononanoate aminotransferase